MNSQLSFLADPLDVRYVEWLRANGHVLDALRTLAVEWRQAGHDRCAIGMLTEVARWQHGLRQANEGDGLAINNSMRSRLARTLLATTPQLPPDFFACRTLRADRTAA